MKRILLLLITLLTTSFQAISQQTQPQEDPNLAAFHLDAVVAQLDSTGRAWLPFIQGKNVLTGLYKLKAGAEDRQRPHDTDEVYYVVSGKARFKAGDETVEVRPGSILFVKAAVEHRFFDIEEELVLVVFFDQ